MKTLHQMFEYLLGDKTEVHPMFGGTPSVTDLCFTVFMRAKHRMKPNRPKPEDPEPYDWMNDTVPIVKEAIARWRKETLSGCDLSIRQTIEETSKLHHLELPKDFVSDLVFSLADRQTLRDIRQVRAPKPAPTEEGWYYARSSTHQKILPYWVSYCPTLQSWRVKDGDMLRSLNQFEFFGPVTIVEAAP